MKLPLTRPTIVLQTLVILFATGLYGSSDPAVSTVRRVGGGYSNAGMDGEYFSNPDLTGSGAFLRKDVRLNFDWETLLPIGGSIAKAYATFPHENFSVRWTGGVIPRFSEPYTFVAEADEGIRVRIRAADADKGAWTMLIDHWSKAGTQSSKPQTLVAGKSYELQVEYRHLTGPALCRLSWQSPSTPSEVVDVVTDNGLNLSSYDNYCFADKSKTGRWFKINGKTPDADSLDETDSPKRDGEYVLTEALKAINGTWLIEFNGKAELALRGGKFIANGKEYPETLPRGEGYDPQRNLTRFKLVVSREEGTTFLAFRKTSRDGTDSASPTGITNLHTMRPIAPGSDTPHSSDEIIFRPMKSMVECFTCVRWLQMANGFGFPTKKWEERTPADFPRFTQYKSITNSDTGKTENQQFGENYEYLIMFANETGRDLYLTSPLLADNEYYIKLAKLLKFGSDGMEPYNEPQAKPKYPPLNPNLRVYLEVGNEIWNWAFTSSKQSSRTAQQEIDDKTEESKIFNYNGAGNYRAWHALRTVRASDGFRSIFGDAAMGDRIRFLIEYQYANANSTALNSLQFLDAWFNNGDGQHVQNPHPANYYIWGGGGAAYYGVANGEGEQSTLLLADSGFEEPVVADGVAQTGISGSGWKFTGGAAIYRNLTSAIASYQVAPGSKQIGQAKNTAVGFKFRTGAKPVYVYCAGRVFIRASKGAHITILRESDKAIVYQADTAAAMAFLTKVFGYYYTPMSDKPVALEPSTVYYAFTTDPAESSHIDGDNTTAKASPEIELMNAAQAKVGDLAKPETWVIKDTKPGCVFGPVTFLYSTQPDLKSNLPQPPEGQQAAILRGEGEFSQTVNFPKAGMFALTFNATQPDKGGGTFDLFVDDQKISPAEQRDYRSATPAEHARFGGFGRNNGFKEEWGSAPFNIAVPGPHIIRFVSIGKEVPNNYAVFDDIRIMSMDAIMESGFGAGSALGQPVENAWNERQRFDSQLCLAFGLPRVSYETGWSLGGDFYQKPIQNYAKFKDPRAEKINDAAINNFHLSGANMPVWGVYLYWPPNDFEHGKEYSIMRSIIGSSNRLPVEADNGFPVPVTLTLANSMEKFQKSADRQKPLSAQGDWIVWTIVCPTTGDYLITPTVTGEGTFMLETDGHVLIDKVTSGTAKTIKLTKGIHGIRIRRGEGDVVLTQIEVKAGQ